MSTHPTNEPLIATPSLPMAPHRVKLVKNPNYVKSGMKSYAHLLRKYCFNPTLEGPFTMAEERVVGESRRVFDRFRGRPTQVAPKRLMKKGAGADGQPGKVCAEDVQNDSEYLAQCWSSELSKSVQAAGKATHHNIFDHSRSHTYKGTPGAHWSITYGDGSSAGGNVGTDIVEIGGIQIHNQAVEIANTMAPEFQQGAGDGLLGLAFGSLNTVLPRPVKTPVENMIAQSSIQPSAELFTAYLGGYKDANDADKGQSFYTFGFIDEPTIKATGSSIHYTPVNSSNGFWQVTSASYSVNGTAHTIATGSTASTGIIDTGTTLALVDDETCKNIYAAIPGSKLDTSQGGYVFPTTTPASSLPTVLFDIGGKMFRINKEDIAYADAGNGNTFGGIQSRGDLPFNIYGDTFLKNVYAIFDVGRMQFGCVQRIDPDMGSSCAAGCSKACTSQCPAVQPSAPPSAPNANTPAPVPAVNSPAPAPAPAAH